MRQQRRRLDRELVSRGLAQDESEALRLITDRRVLVDGGPALQPSRMVAPSDQVRVLRPPPAFVTRGGLKLAGALDDLGIAVEGRRCLDVGAGAGGFTDCLLQRGAREIVAVDVGYGDFDWSLRNDTRVRLLERVNIRTADPSLLGPPFDVIVADLSFISLVAVLDRLVAAAAPGADFVLLVKPQFEAPRADVAPGGVVDDPAVWVGALERVATALATRGIGTAAIAPSRVRGAEGNQEFFLWAREDAGPVDPAALDAAVRTGAAALEGAPGRDRTGAPR